MKYILSIFVLIVSLLVSCENKRDTDSLAGFWQLTEWRTADGAIHQPEGRIYYAIQLTVIKFQCFEDRLEGKYDSRLSHFEHRSDEIILKDAYKPHDGGLRDEALSDFAQLSKFGVSPDGRFRIVSFDDDRLVLQTTVSRLTFRRY